ncbi:hypothetical protein T484DRAFT_1758424, partial [Baffinella frigidus]
SSENHTTNSSENHMTDDSSDNHTENSAVENHTANSSDNLKEVEEYWPGTPTSDEDVTSTLENITTVNKTTTSTTAADIPGLFNILQVFSDLSNVLHIVSEFDKLMVDVTANNTPFKYSNNNRTGLVGAIQAFSELSNVHRMVSEINKLVTAANITPNNTGLDYIKVGMGMMNILQTLSKYLDLSQLTSGFNELIAMATTPTDNTSVDDNTTTAGLVNLMQAFSGWLNVNQMVSNFDVTMTTANITTNNITLEYITNNLGSINQLMTTFDIHTNTSSLDDISRIVSDLFNLKQVLDIIKELMGVITIAKNNELPNEPTDNMDGSDQPNIFSGAQVWFNMPNFTKWVLCSGRLQSNQYQFDPSIFNNTADTHDIGNAVTNFLRFYVDNMMASYTVWDRLNNETANNVTHNSTELTRDISCMHNSTFVSIDSDILTSHVDMVDDVNGLETRADNTTVNTTTNTTNDATIPMETHTD